MLNSPSKGLRLVTFFTHFFHTDKKEEPDLAEGAEVEFFLTNADLETEREGSGR